MFNKLVWLLLFVVAGCGNPSEQTTPKPADGIHAKASNAASAQETSQQRLKAELESFKTNPQPLFDLAQNAIRKAIAETTGDESATAAVITIQPDTLKTFGPEKWTVRADLQFNDKAGVARKTISEVTIQVIFDKVQVRSVRLDV